MKNITILYCKLSIWLHFLLLIFQLELKQYHLKMLSYISFTFVVNLETDGANTFIRLKMKPHLVGHADDEVWNKAACQPDKTHASESDVVYER